jgi:7-carboxy-7-deazaguanine synthase
MRGENPIRPPDNGDGSLLQVKRVFPTLQGEGPYAGVPAVFIRLGGCNLNCYFCDTNFEDFVPVSLDQLLQDVRELSLNELGEAVRNLVVITGGEPLRQNIVPLCERLLAEGFAVQIETNGTLFRPLPEEVSIVCSPKNGGQGYFPIREDLLPRIEAFKFILSSHDENYACVPDVGQSAYRIPVYVQPMDEYDAWRNAENLNYATRLALKHGYIMSIQTHKLLGIE